MAHGARTPEQRRRRWLSASVSGAAHLGVLALLLWPRTALSPPPKPAAQPSIQVSLLPTPKPPGPPDDAQAIAGAPAITLPPLPQVSVPLVTIARNAAPDNSDLLSDSQLAGAARAGEGGGGGGGGCDMARAVQQALRRDPLVRGAVADANRLGKASMLWNGDWVQSGGQDGKGLAAVRQAVLWEVGFSPQACRNERMHGLVLLTLADGSTRFAVGGDDWRWSDLLGVGAVR